VNLKHGLGITEGHRKWHLSIRHPLTFHSNHRPLSRTVSEIDGDFSRKSQIFRLSVYFTLPLKGFPLELSIGAMGQKTRMMGLPDGRKSFKISLAVLTQYRRVTDSQPAIFR